MRGRLPQPIEPRFWDKVIVAPSGCWIWVGCRNKVKPGPYGMMYVNNRKVMAHRVAWELFVGSIPPGLVYDHYCWRTYCVNPLHGKLTTHGKNCWRNVVRLANLGQQKDERGRWLPYAKDRDEAISDDAA